MNGSADISSPEGAIEDLLSQPEGKALDFEAKVPGTEEASHLIASIANSGGGKIVLGAEGENEVSGLARPEQARTVFEDAAGSVVPPVSLEFAVESVRDHSIGVVTVSASEGISLAPSGPIVRRDEGGRSHALTKDEIAKALSDGGVQTKLDQLLQLSEDQNERLKRMQEDNRALRKKVDRAGAEAKRARSLPGQVPGLLAGAVLGAILSFGLPELWRVVFG